jgi:hypothetical protein
MQMQTQQRAQLAASSTAAKFIRDLVACTGTAAVVLPAPAPGRAFRFPTPKKTKAGCTRCAGKKAHKKDLQLGR